MEPSDQMGVLVMLLNSGDMKMNGIIYLVGLVVVVMVVLSFLGIA